MVCREGLTTSACRPRWCPPRAPAVSSFARRPALRNAASERETAVAADHVAVPLDHRAQARGGGRLPPPPGPPPALDGQLLDRRERRLRDLRGGGACSVGRGG